jgi:PAS domain S-box-containing protein
LVLTALLWTEIGICVASGLTHLTVWRGPAQGHAHRILGLLCLILAALVFFDVRCYAAPSPEAYISEMRVVMALLFSFWVALAWFCHAYTGQGTQRGLLALTGFYLVLSVVNLTQPFTALFSGPVVLRKILLPLGEAPVVGKGPLGIAAAAGYLGSLGLVVWGLMSARRQCSLGRCAEGRALGFGLGAVFLGVVSDGVVDALALNWFYMTELGFVIMALVMNVRLAQDWVDRQRETERIDAALRRSEADLSRAQEVARIGSWRYDISSRDLYWSDEMYRLLGVEQGSRVDRDTFAQLVHPEDRERIITATETIRTGGSLDQRCRVRVGAENRWVHVLAKGEVGSRGNVTAILGTTRDITDEVALETQLFQAQKMEAVGQLAGGVAHDFNNLLQVMKGNVELALLTLEPKHAAIDLVEDAIKAGDRAAVLVRQLLAFSRLQVLKLAALDMNDVVGGMMQILARAIGEHVRIDFVPGHNLGTVRADRGQLEVVLTNLAVNARDAMTEGGTLTISTANVTIDDAFVASRPWARAGDYVRLRVADTGSGMDGATAAHVFEPFFTTKELGRGTGLGLATAYGIVKQHNGIIDLVSALGGGTTVDVFLPRVEARPAESPRVSEAPAPGGTEGVLVVEDDRDVRSCVRAVLVGAGYRVLEAGDGHEAIGMPEEETSLLSLAILDVQLPGRGGRAVYETLSQRHPGMRFLFLSGFSPDNSLIRDLVDRGLEFSQKPVSRTELLRAVRRVLDR